MLGPGSIGTTPHRRTTVGRPAFSGGDVAARRIQGEMRDVPVTAASGDQRSRPIRRRSARSPSTSRTRSLPTCAAGSKRPGGPTARRIRPRACGSTTIQALASYWAHGLRLAHLREALRGPAALRHRDRWRRHPLHPRPLEARGRAAADRHARLARLDDRAAQDHRAARPIRRPTAPSAADAFDLVIPSLPGHGFSGKPTETGWDPIRIARAWVVLMKRLGYERYVAQGGDWGNAVTEQLALLKPDGLLGIHTNMPATLSPEISQGARSGGAAAGGPLSRREEGIRHPGPLLRDRHRLCAGDGPSGRRRSTPSRIRRSAWPPGCSTTTSEATSSSSAPSSDRPAGSRATTSSTTSPTTG